MVLEKEYNYRCFSYLPGDAPMRGSWTFQIKQMITDVMKTISLLR